MEASVRQVRVARARTVSRTDGPVDERTVTVAVRDERAAALLLALILTLTCTDAPGATSATT